VLFAYELGADRDGVSVGAVGIAGSNIMQWLATGYRG